MQDALADHEVSKEDGKTAISRRNSTQSKPWLRSAQKFSSMRSSKRTDSMTHSTISDDDEGGGNKGSDVAVNGKRALGTAVNTLVDGALDAALEAAVATLFAGGVVK